MNMQNKLKQDIMNMSVLKMSNGRNQISFLF